MENKNWIAWVDMQPPLNTPGGTLHVNGAILVNDKRKYSLDEAVSQPIDSQELLLQVNPAPEVGDTECLLNFKKDLMEKGQYKSIRIISAGSDDISIQTIETNTIDQNEVIKNLNSKSDSPRIRPKSISYYLFNRLVQENNFFYDSYNRLERIDGNFDNGNYKYDQSNRLISVTNDLETKTFQYDNKGRFSVMNITGELNLPHKSISPNSILKLVPIKKKKSGNEGHQRWKFDYSIRGRLSKIFIYEVEEGTEVFSGEMLFDYTISGKLKKVKFEEETLQFDLDDYYNPLYNTYALFILQYFMPIYNNAVKIVSQLFTETYQYKYNESGFPIEEDLKIRGNQGEQPTPHYSKKIITYENY